MKSVKEKVKDLFEEPEVNMTNLVYCEYCKKTQKIEMGVMIANPPYINIISSYLVENPNNIAKQKAENLMKFNLIESAKNISEDRNRNYFLCDLLRTYLILGESEEAKEIKKNLYGKIPIHLVICIINDEIRYGVKLHEIKNDLEKLEKLIKNDPSTDASTFVKILLLYSKLKNKEKMREYEFKILQEIKKKEDDAFIYSLPNCIQELPLYLLKKMYEELDKILDKLLSLSKDKFEKECLYLEKIILRNLFCKKLKEEDEAKLCIDIYKETIDLIEKKCPSNLLELSLLTLVNFPDEYKIEIDGVIKKIEKIIDRLSDYRFQKTSAKIILADYLQKKNCKDGRIILKEIMRNNFFKKKPLISWDILEILLNLIGEPLKIREYLQNYLRVNSKEYRGNFFDVVNAYWPFNFLIRKFSETKDKKWLNLLFGLENEWSGRKGDLYVEIAKDFLNIGEKELAQKYLNKTFEMELSEGAINNKIILMTKIKKNTRQLFELYEKLNTGTLRFDALINIYFSLDTKEDERDLKKKIKEEVSNIGVILCPNCRRSCQN